MANESAKIREKVLRFVSAGKGLDLGCGPAAISLNAIGVDEEEGGGAWRVRDRVLDYLRSQDPSGFDFIFSSHYLEHDRSWREVLRECCRVLRPGGNLMLYLPDGDVYVNADGEDPNGLHINRWTIGTFVVEASPHLPGMKLMEAEARNTTPAGHAFTGNGHTEHPGCAGWEYSFFVRYTKTAHSII